MAGYNGFSKSNNAITAEQKNKFPATAAARMLGVKPAAIVKFLQPCGWHHTSKFYNKTKFYDIDVFLNTSKYPECERLWAEKILVQMKEYDPAQYAAKYENCFVQWIHWGGSRRKPKAIIQQLSECEVIISSRTVYISHATCIFTKRVDTNGLVIREGQKYIIDNRKENYK